MHQPQPGHGQPPGQPQPPGYGHSPHPGHGRPPPPNKSGGFPVVLIVVLVLFFVAIPVLGIMAAIAIPAFIKYERRSKTVEAKVEIARLFDSASAYFQEEHFDPDAGIAETAPHGCPNDGRLEGSVGPTPPLAVNCNDGPSGRCIPAAGGGGPGSYDIAAWTNDPVWSSLDFLQEQGHTFHYAFHWSNDPSGYGACQFTIQAFADLDDDGVFSTFERYGVGDSNGVNAAAGLYIDREVE